MKRTFAAIGLVALLSPLALRAGPEPLAQDSGATGTWQKLLKLQTTASAMHTTAHPDDEHGGVLAQLSRGQGARVSLLTLNRGESGDNAIGPELFDAVGLIRTEELLMAGRYYGLDRQYFTTAIDYGYSKRLEEALTKWGRENVLRDMVRVIRIDRPFVLIARFQGNARDGHGNHEAAGILTQEAYRVAGDPTVFPEQIRDGLRPWQPLKLYMGGVRENEDWTLRTDTGEYCPWLGDSYQNFARLGLAFQRSQNGGRVNAQAGPSIAYYKRLASVVDAPVKERTFFEGIDASIPRLFSAIRRPAPPGAATLLSAIDGEVRAAVAAFTMQNPSASVPALARGLTATRAAIAALGVEPDAVFILKIKEQQFMDAINTALGIDFQAVAAVAAPVVPGQRVNVEVSLTSRGSDIRNIDLALVAAGGWATPGSASDWTLRANEVLRQTLTAGVAVDAALSRPYYERASIVEPRYTLIEGSQFGRPAAEAALSVRAVYTVASVRVQASAIVRRREPHLPYGDELRELMVVPTVAVNVAPRVAIVSTAASPARRQVDVRVELLNNQERGVSGELTLRLPAGWTSVPAAAPFTFARAGERATFRFSVAMPSPESRDYRIEAVATIAGRSYAEGYDVIEHRDLETRYLYHPASTLVRGVDVAIAPGLKIGYLMGIGDDVPAGIAQLGASVTLLAEQDLATGDLGQFDAIVTGTRAYAVRDDLKTYNRRLLDYVRDGGNMIVLYNTQEFVPNTYAPFPAQLPAGAEEVSEEDSPVDILAPSHPLLTTPNRITKADFDGWVEQRGSKFFTEWDAAYTPLIATHDQGQAPQRGGWVTANYGKGHYTYFAYAFHRQLPYGVPGAYRLLANLLSLGK